MHDSVPGQKYSPREKSARVRRFRDFLASMNSGTPVGAIDGFMDFASYPTATFPENPNPEWLPAFHDVTITKVIQETTDCTSFEFVTPHATVFRPRPGQFIPIRVTIDGCIHERCYAISSLAIRGDAPRITIKRVLHGVVSNWCHDHLKTGMTISIGRPAGLFKLEDENSSLVFVSAGIGIAPIYPMIREALFSGNQKIKVLIFDRREADTAFLLSLRGLALANSPRLSVIESFTGDDYASDAQLKEPLIGLSDSNLYVCGPDSFSTRVEAAAISSGFDQDRIFTNSAAIIGVTSR